MGLHEKINYPFQKIRLFFKTLGPGLITGAADDDPSGIATYSIAGAQFGTRLLWTSLLTWPLMASVQMMCARIGMVTGSGLTKGLKKKFPKPVLILFCGALFFANTLNVGADLAAMADASQMLTGVSSHFFVLVFALGISWATVFLKYHQIVNTLKWLALFLFAYVVVAIRMKPDWGKVFHDTFVPSIPRSAKEWGMIVAILGTTISPYLFFWQASQEVEEEKLIGRKTLQARMGATPHEILIRRMDVGVGTFFSNSVMFFIILATALTLSQSGITEIETSQQVAEALRPIAGDFAYLLYTFGLLGVGFLAIPTLTGSAAYAMAETFNWSQGLDERPKKAKHFYSVIIVSTLFAVIFDFADLNPVKVLYYSAILNGLLAPFLLMGILLVASDTKIMNGQRSSWLSRSLVSFTMLLMFGAAVGMFIF